MALLVKFSVSEELNSVETPYAKILSDFSDWFQKNLIVWKPLITDFSLGRLSLFQKNLIVWKLACIIRSSTSSFAFQKNLIVWKH